MLEFIAVLGFLSSSEQGLVFVVGALVSHCGGFSCCGAQALGAWVSAVATGGS